MTSHMAEQQKLIYYSASSVTSMFNVDVDRSANAPPLKSTVYIGYSLMGATTILHVYTKCKNADILTPHCRACSLFITDPSISCSPYE